MYLLVLKQLSTMFLIGVCGFIFAKVFKVTDGEQKFLSKLLLYFINPCLVVNSFNIEFQSEKLKSLGFAILIGLLFHLVMILIAVCFSLFKKGEGEEIALANDYKRIDRLSIIFTNCGFIGIPLIRGVFGDEGVFFLMGYLILFNVFVWTYGLYIMSGSINLKKIFTNPNIIAVCLGILIFCLPFTLPEIIAKPLSMISDLNTGTAMLLIGMLFAGFKFEKSYLAGIIKVLLVRLLLIAFVNLLIIWGIYSLTKNHFDSRMILFVLYICSMCPTATSVPGLAVLFDKDGKYSSLLVSLTSLFCMLTIPAFVALAEYLLY